VCGVLNKRTSNGQAMSDRAGKTWDMQWKVVRRMSECLGYVRLGRDAAGHVRGRASITFSKDGRGVKVVWCSMRAPGCPVAMFDDRPSRDIAGLLLASVERERCPCLIANRRSVIAGSKPDAEGAKATSTSSILRWQQRMNRRDSRFEVENGVRRVWLASRHDVVAGKTVGLWRVGAFAR
jgi:hypothetical protein